jgi:phosphopantothenoylcysteine decarboxylase/phosphopantothenate--cysteine ligase
MLEGTNVALGVTGSIAAVRTVELAHELRRQGATVRAVMTESAQGIIHPWALEFGTESPVVTELTGAVEHVELCGTEGWADVFVIAPATANTIGKIAGAIDDSPVTTCATTAIGAEVPVVVAPAMHEPMYDHPGVLETVAQLESWGIDVLDPRVEEGKAKIPTEDATVTATARAVGDQPLADTEIVVTSGATTESIDPLRTLSNRASGRTGQAVARACAVAGADVTLVHDGPSVAHATVRQVESAAEMTESVLDAATGADAVVSAAAVSDYTVSEAPEKIRSGQAELSLSLSPTDKLLDTVRDEHPDLPLVGFKVETDVGEDALVERARSLKERVGLAFVVANDASVMGEAATNAVLVREQTAQSYAGDKQGLGALVASELAATLAERA